MKRNFRYLQVLAVLVGLSLGGSLGFSCAHVTPTVFKDAVVSCTLENSSNAQAGAAVLGCLTGALSSDYTSCLAGLATAGTWTVTEIACVVRKLANESAVRLNSGNAAGTDSAVLTNGNAWLRSQNIQFR